MIWDTLYLRIYVSASASAPLTSQIICAMATDISLDPASASAVDKDKDINLTFHTTYRIYTQHSTIQINPKSQT